MRNLTKYAIVLLSFIPDSSSVWAQTTYTFTKIAEVTDNVQTFGLASYLSDTGSVAYTQYTPTLYPNSLTQLLLPAAYISEQGVVRRLGDSTLPTVALDINNLGAVLFVQYDRDGRSHLLVDSAGALTEISSTGASNFATYAASSDGAGGSINDNGDVLFGAIQDSGVYGFYVQNADGSTTTVAEMGSVYPFFISVGGGSRINNNRNVALTVGSDIYYGAAGSPLTDLSMTTPSLNDQPAALGYPALNNNDVLAFAVAGQSTAFPGGAILESVLGSTPQPLLLGTGTRAGQVYTPSLNDLGDLSYFASDPATFATSLRLLHSGDQIPTVVLASGNALFDSTAISVGVPVHGVAYRNLNRFGQIAFGYTLATGARGVALASPNQ